MYTVAIVTSSDKGSKGEREDKSGAVIREIVEKSGFQVKRYVILPDEKELLKEEYRGNRVFSKRYNSRGY